MPEVDIPMNGWSEERLAQERKWATSRTERYGEPGDTFEVNGIEYVLTHIVKVPLGVVAEQFYDIEGADSRAEFIEVWEDIHYRRGFDPEWSVWLHLFRKRGEFQ